MHIRKGLLSGKGQRGSVIVIFAVCLFLLIGLAALAIDIGSAYTARSELQNVADAAALAGARYLGNVYVTLYSNNPSAMGSHTFTKAEVYSAVEAVATQNKAANKSISIDIDDVVIGKWIVDDANPDPPDVIENLTGPDAVRVIARRDGSINTPISTFFGRIFNIDTINVVSERAIAALTGPSTVEEAKINAPFGLSSLNECEEPIHFSPTPDSCAGWHNFLWDHDASDMGTIFLSTIKRHVYDNPDHPHSHWTGQKWLEENFPDLDLVKLDTALEKVLKDAPIPQFYETGDSFDYNGGSVAALFNGSYLDRAMPYDGDDGTITGTPTNSPAPFFALFEYFRYRDDDGNDSVWTVIVPIYKETAGCENPSGLTRVDGWARIVIEMPVGPPEKIIDIELNCELVVVEGRGSGTTYGNLRGTIPNLVK